MKLTNEEKTMLNSMEYELMDIRTRMRREGYPLWLDEHEFGALHKINKTWNENIKLVADLEAMYLKEFIINSYSVPE